MGKNTQIKLFEDKKVRTLWDKDSAVTPCIVGVILNVQKITL